MEVLEFLKEWINEHPTTTSIIKYVVWVSIIILFISFLRRILKKSLPDSSVRYKAQKGIEIIGYVFIVFLTISYFSGNIKDFTLAIGLLTAGITIINLVTEYK